MGYGEVIGNGSVEWIVVHEDATGTKQVLDRETNATGRPRPHKVRLAQEGEGHDPIPFADIGVRKGHPGQFKVTMRFPNRADAEVACNTATKSVVERGGHYFLEVLVPAINRNNPSANPPAEVRVDW